ncbi:WD40 repeat-like protein [Clavulina sp. PMI_390]|nr:WD40 repeat-like protein [Clavulina sp. PMI_390]
MGKDIEPDDGDDQWEDESGDEGGDIEADGDKMDEDPKASNPNDLSQYKLDEYDEDTGNIASGPFSNIKGLTYYRDNEDDPYITLKEDEEEEERQELEVLPSDNLLVIAKTEDDISHLEVYVYDESEDNLYVHHDLMLPSFPLCLEWLDYKPASSSTSDDGSSSSQLPGNYIAVGTFDPEIEIWSLDTVDGLYPDGILGRPDKSREHIPVPLGTGKKKRKKEKPRKANAEYHVDAVLGLSWNKSHRNLIASASADKTVKLWDLSKENAPAIRSFDVHKDKVQAVQWNQSEPTVLLTGSYDRTVRMFDTRAPTSGVGAVLGADVEALRWDPFEPNAFYVSLENGLVLNFDARTLPSDLNSPSPARFTLSAHDGAVSGLDVNPHIRGCLATGGTDKVVKVWNIEEQGGNRSVSMVTSRDLGVGKVFTVGWSPDDPLTLVAGGSKAQLQIWEVGQNAGVRSTFKTKLAQAGRELREKKSEVIGVVDDEDDDDDEGDAE